MRPSSNFSEAVGKGGGSWSGDGKFSGNEELDIISHVGVRCCQGEACRGLTGDNQAPNPDVWDLGRVGGRAVVHVDELLSVREI